MAYKFVSDKIVDTRNDNVVIRGKSHEELHDILRKLKRGYAFADFTPDFFCQERSISQS